MIYVYEFTVVFQHEMLNFIPMVAKVSVFLLELEEDHWRNMDDLVIALL
jgi:hypothetical protein